MVRNKIEDLLSRIVMLDVLFTTCPSDVAEQRHRNKLIQYVAIPTLDLVLNPSQQFQGC